MRSGKKRQAVAEEWETLEEDEPEPSQAPAPSRRARIKTDAGSSQPQPESQPSSAAAAAKVAKAAKAADAAELTGGHDNREGVLGSCMDEKAELEQMNELITQYQDEAASEELTSPSFTSDMEQDKLVREVMRHMIFRHSEKPNVPVPRGELSKLLSSNKRVTSKRIIKLAQARLSKSMGLELKELTVASEKDIRAGLRDEGSLHFVLRSIVPSRLRATYINPPEAAAERGLEMTILALLTVNGEQITEDDLWRHLEDLGIQRGMGREALHPTFGCVEERIKHMITKRYLRVSKDKGPQAATSYMLGANAEDEITPRILNSFVSSLFGTINSVDL